jgi:hypothetical protein
MNGNLNSLINQYDNKDFEREIKFWNETANNRVIFGADFGTKLEKKRRNIRQKHS